MRILVTGPDGFVGKAVCEAFVRKEFFVRGAQWQKMPLSEGCEPCIVGNIGPNTSWNAALDGIDAVVHLAGRVHIMKDTATDPTAAFRSVNVDGTRCLAKNAAKFGVKRFLFLSSVKVNGEVTNERTGPFTEISTENPQGPYAISKWEAEQLLREIESEFGMEVVIFRPPLIYGPGVKANFLRLIQYVAHGAPLPFGAIQNRRSFIGLTNIVDLICKCIRHPAAGGETFLVSDGEDISTPELIRRIATALNRPAKLVPVPVWLMKAGGGLLGKADQVDRLTGSLQIDCSKAKRLLEWKQPLRMEDELSRVAKWWKTGCVSTQ